MQATSPDHAPRLVIDEQLARIAIRCVCRSMETIFSLAPEAAPWSCEHTGERTAEYPCDVSGVIGFVQDRHEATLSVSFEARTIFFLMAKAYGRDFDSIDSSIRDGVGELTNVIFASIKRELNDRGYRIRMAIPDVVLGAHPPGTSSNDRTPAKRLIVPFKAADHPFYLQVTQVEKAVAR